MIQFINVATETFQNILYHKYFKCLLSIDMYHKCFRSYVSYVFKNYSKLAFSISTYIIIVSKAVSHMNLKIK